MTFRLQLPFAAWSQAVDGGTVAELTAWQRRAERLATGLLWRLENGMEVHFQGGGGPIRGLEME